MTLFSFRIQRSRATESSLWMLIVKIHVALLRSCPRVSPRWFSPAYATKAGFEVPRGAAKEAVSTSSTPPPPQRSGVQEGKQTGTERGKEGGKRGMSQRGFGGAGRGGESGSCTAVLFLNRRIRRYACGLRMCLPKCYLHFLGGWGAIRQKRGISEVQSGSIQRSFPSSRIMYWSERYQQLPWVKPNKNMWTSQQLAMWLSHQMWSRPHVGKTCTVRWGGLFKYQLSLDQTLASLENCMLRKKHQNAAQFKGSAKGKLSSSANDARCIFRRFLKF